MKLKITLFSFLLGFSSAWASTGLVDPNSCELSYSDYASLENNQDFLRIREKSQKLCTFEGNQALNKDEKFLLSKWGSQICDQLLQGDYSLLCRYNKIVNEKKLNIAEAMALAGYTSEFYNYLSPQNIAVMPGDASYEGYDIFNKVLKSAVSKLSKYSEYQYKGEVYRGTSLHGVSFAVSERAFSFNRWTSTSCVKEISFGPELIEKSQEEKDKITAEALAEGGFGSADEIPGLEYLFYSRDPKSIPKKLTSCQKVYFDENPNPPVTEGSNFGSGDLKITILPASKMGTKRITLYPLSVRRSEAEILFPPDAKFRVKRVIAPEAGDGMNTELTLEEVP